MSGNRGGNAGFAVVIVQYRRLLGNGARILFTLQKDFFCRVAKLPLPKDLFPQVEKANIIGATEPRGKIWKNSVKFRVF